MNRDRDVAGAEGRRTGQATGVAIRGTGIAIPPRVMTNDELAKMVDTNDEWITQRTGIKRRRFASDSESTLDLAYQAAQRALEDAALDATEIDYVGDVARGLGCEVEVTTEARAFMQT